MLNDSNPVIPSSYLRQIGRKGGKKSRRTLSPDQARRMVAVREARRAFRMHKADCFWSFDPEWHIGLDEVPLVANTLKKTGNRNAFEQARTLLRLLEG